MRQKGDRFFALFGAILFLVTASAFSILVVWQLVSGSGSNDTTATDKAAVQAATCQANQAEPTFPAPKAVKVEGALKQVKTTDIEPGTGPTIKDGDCIVTKYSGSLAVSGKVFQENFTQPTAFAFRYNTGSVVPGFDAGLKGMKVGATRRIEIPASQGYGAQAQGDIPANSDLVFVVKILRVQ